MQGKQLEKILTARLPADRPLDQNQSWENLVAAPSIDLAPFCSQFRKVSICAARQQRADIDPLLTCIIDGFVS